MAFSKFLILYAYSIQILTLLQPSGLFKTEDFRTLTNIYAVQTKHDKIVIGILDSPDIDFMSNISKHYKYLLFVKVRARLKYENPRIIMIEGMCSINEMKIIKVTYVYFDIN